MLFNTVMVSGIFCHGISYFNKSGFLVTNYIIEINHQMNCEQIIQKEFCQVNNLLNLVTFN